MDSRSPDEIVKLLGIELKMTTAYLHVHPKVYWIWNHRKWCLESVPLGPDESEGWRNDLWKMELRVVERMLEADPRNCPLPLSLPSREESAPTCVGACSPRVGVSPIHTRKSACDLPPEADTAGRAAIHPEEDRGELVQLLGVALSDENPGRGVGGDGPGRGGVRQGRGQVRRRRGSRRTDEVSWAGCRVRAGQAGAVDGSGRSVRVVVSPLARRQRLALCPCIGRDLLTGPDPSEKTLRRETDSIRELHEIEPDSKCQILRGRLSGLKVAQGA